MLIHHFTLMGTSHPGPDVCKPTVMFCFLKTELCSWRLCWGRNLSGWALPPKSSPGQVLYSSFAI